MFWNKKVLAFILSLSFLFGLLPIAAAESAAASSLPAVGDVLHGFKVKEVSIVFTDRKLGKSKMSSGIFGEAFWGVLKMRFKKIIPAK